MNILLKNAIKITWPMIFHFFNASAQTYNYGEVLQKSLYFYECQRSGVLPQNNRVNWRGNSGVNDGMDNNVDLTGGWYDAGDHVKFGFPMANAAVKLAWSALESEEAYRSIGQWNILLDNLRWVNNYFIKCHIKKADGSTLKFFGQVGNPKIDHAYWGSAEAMNLLRPSYYVDDSRPGTELTAETAAALAAASMVFEKTDSSYSAKLLAEAITLYAFADIHRGSYTNSIVAAKGYYDSFNGYQDELMWGAIWLYKATREKKYLEKAKGIYTSLPNQLNQNVKQYIGGDSWDNKVFASYLLMAELTGEASYRHDASRFLDYWSQGHEGSRIPYSPGGQAFFSKWGSLRYAANASFLAFMYVKYFQDVDPKHSAIYKAFGIRQVNYILGDNPRRSSYVIGFGNNSPINPHHRNAHGSISGSIKDPVDTKHILYGALVGGPSKPNDEYHDARNNYVENEVSCDYNAGFTGAMAMMVGFFGGKSLDGFPPLD